MKSRRPSSTDRNGDYCRPLSAPKRRQPQLCRNPMECPCIPLAQSSRRAGPNVDRAARTRDGSGEVVAVPGSGAGRSQAPEQGCDPPLPYSEHGSFASGRQDDGPRRVKLQETLTIMSVLNLRWGAESQFTKTTFAPQSPSGKRFQANVQFENP